MQQPEFSIPVSTNDITPLLASGFFAITIAVASLLLVVAAALSNAAFAAFACLVASASAQQGGRVRVGLRFGQEQVAGQRSPFSDLLHRHVVTASFSAQRVATAVGICCQWPHGTISNRQQETCHSRSMQLLPDRVLKNLIVILQCYPRCSFMQE